MFHDNMFELFYANSNTDKVAEPHSYVEYLEQPEGFYNLTQYDVNDSRLVGIAIPEDLDSFLGMLPLEDIPENANQLLIFNTLCWSDDEYVLLTFQSHKTMMYILTNTYPYESCQPLPGGEYIIVETKYVTYKYNFSTNEIFSG